MRDKANAMAALLANSETLWEYQHASIVILACLVSSERQRAPIAIQGHTVLEELTSVASAIQANSLLDLELSVATLVLKELTRQPLALIRPARTARQENSHLQLRLLNARSVSKVRSAQAKL